jgi:MFS transporter, MHS family, citrate/tricarballylate:H+ symporter
MTRPVRLRRRRDCHQPQCTPRIACSTGCRVALGNALEFYDFVTYAFFAAQIGRSFFPAEIPGGSLLASLATFGAGFLTRPLGALVLGRLGDHVGRKPAMLTSFTLIGVGVIGLPGFALGGEVGPSTAFLMEAAPPLRRGLYISLQATSADLAVMIAGLVGVGLASALSPAALDSWGWRVALLAKHYKSRTRQKLHQRYATMGGWWPRD